MSPGVLGAIAMTLVATAASMAATPGSTAGTTEKGSAAAIDDD
jgi:hypothetical protein